MRSTDMHSSPRPWHQWGLMWAIFLSSWWMFQFASPAPPWSHRYETVKPLPMLPIKPLYAASNLDSPIQQDWATDAVHWAFLDSLALDSTPRNLLSGSTAAWFGLHRFFLQLPKAQRQRIEIYHWGDSQIEGDRITGELRRSLQSRWGGHGPGWVMPIMPAPQGHVRSSAEGNILRRTGFGRRRDTSAAKLPFMATNRISEYTRWTVQSTESDGNASCWSVREVWPLHAPERKQNHQRRICKDTLTFHQESLRGVFLGSMKGVLVHNLPMRGASGTLLDGIQVDEWDWLTSAHPPAMVVLQFGGNAIPGMTSPKQASWYAQSMGQLVRKLRKFCPSAVVLFVGPADMGDQPNAYPGLPWVIDALANEITAAGGLFYDLRAAMGGSGSMAQWHRKGWASSDHIHFSRRGAKEAALRLEHTLLRAWRDMHMPHYRNQRP